jgi:hypothetical protein
LVLKDPLAQGEGNAGTMTLREESEYADSEAYRNEHGHHEDEDYEEMRALSAPDHLMDDLLHELQPPKPSFGEVVMYEPHSDSGLGTDVPTADGGSLPGHDYFEHK